MASSRRKRRTGFSRPRSRKARRDSGNWSVSLSNSASCSSVGGGLGVRPPRGDGVPSARNLRLVMAADQYKGTEGTPQGLCRLEVRPGGSQADGGGYSDCNGGPPPCLVIAPHLPCPFVDFALRSTRHPLSNHPNEPLAPTRGIRAYGSRGGRDESEIRVLRCLDGGRSGLSAPSPQGPAGGTTGRLNPRGPTPMAGASYNSPRMRGRSCSRAASASCWVSPMAITSSLPCVSRGPVL